MISLERGLKHMAWANQRVFASLEGLPDEALESYIVNPEWTAGEITRHICNGASWYFFRLKLGENNRFEPLTRISDVAEYAKRLAIIDQALITIAHQDDEELVTQFEGREVTRWKSTIITQAIHHATEHRAQLIDALESKGYAPINLDDIDLWNFDDFERSN
jgi:uncharacterized damage-inducible protein DinB